MGLSSLEQPGRKRIPTSHKITIELMFRLLKGLFFLLYFQEEAYCQVDAAAQRVCLRQKLQHLLG